MSLYILNYIMSKEYYSILWLSKWSTWEEIKKAYRKLAMQHHPDRWWDAEKFKEINEAYSVLWDEWKKREYDTYGRVWWGSPFWNTGGFGVDVDLWDIFEQFFGGWWNRSTKGRKKSSNFSGEDIETTLSLDLKTSVVWWKSTIKYEKYVVCHDCKWVWWAWKSICPDCHGWWYVKYRQQTMFGTIEHTWACENCNGTGEILEKVCNKCWGQKRLRKTVELEIDIPAGIDDGMVIRINGDGNEWIWSSAWDLYVKFKVNTIDKNLKRRWVDLHYDLEIDIIEAILWTSKEVHIPIIGKRNINIDAGTQVGMVIKISWDGVKYIDKDKKWDLFINIIIKIPKKITEAERVCYEKIAQEKKINVHNKKWIFEKIFG